MELFHNTADSVTVIGGADGPTAVFLAGRFPDRSLVGAAVMGVLAVLVLAFLIWRMRKREREERRER